MGGHLEASLVPPEATVVVELLALAAMVLVASRRPRTATAITVLVAVVIGFLQSTLHHKGAALVGKPTMRAAVISPGRDAYYDVKRVQVPNHGDESMLVQVKGSSIMPANIKLDPTKLPVLRHLVKLVFGPSAHLVFGWPMADVTGVIVGVGNSSVCRSFRAGDEIYGLALFGAWAEYAWVRCNMAAKKPAALDWDTTAALPSSVLCVLQAYTQHGVTEGSKVLVLGASGGVGVFSTTLGAHGLRADITGVSSRKNVALVERLGASRVVAYDDAQQLQGLLDGPPEFDLILDLVSSFESRDMDYEPMTRRLLKPGGHYATMLGKRLDIVRGFVSFGLGLNLQRDGLYHFVLEPDAKHLETAARWFDEGALNADHVPIDSRFSLGSTDDVVAATDRVMSRRAVGKVIVKVA